jgi:hypothetical protein
MGEFEAYDREMAPLATLSGEVHSNPNFADDSFARQFPSPAILLRVRGGPALINSA